MRNLQTGMILLTNEWSSSLADGIRFEKVAESLWFGGNGLAAANVRPAQSWIALNKLTLEFLSQIGGFNKFKQIFPTLLTKFVVASLGDSFFPNQPNRCSSEKRQQVY